MEQRLQREISLLYTVEAQFKLPAAPVINQLLADAERLLPDILPRPPGWTSFDWPQSGNLDFTQYWKSYDWLNR